MARGAARRQCGYWAVGSGTHICRSAYGISLYVHQHQPDPASCCRAVVLATGHRQSTGATIYDTVHHAAVYIKIPLFSHFLSSCCKTHIFDVLKLYMYK